MFDRELVKGSTSLLLLQLLGERDMYGYELVKELEKRSGNEFSIKEGTLYPALHKLEKQEYIEYYWQEQEKGLQESIITLRMQGKKCYLKKPVNGTTLFQ